MKVFERIKDINSLVLELKSGGQSVGFVPTMGALHKGHLSLVQQSVNANSFTIVSIFVNPTQFNDASDLENYPRNFEADMKMLEEVGCNAIFYPSVEEMYPEKDTRVFDFKGIDTRMEGEHRPGHFNGVAQVVSKLFNAIPANNAYFGMKDFQQLAIIKDLVHQLNLPIKIVPCEIIREPNGLAMSSRNERLTSEQRNQAEIIYQTLTKSTSLIHKQSINDTKQFVKEVFKTSPFFELEYFDIVNSSTLLSVINKDELNGATGCIAVWADKVRLIDNIIFNF